MTDLEPGIFVLFGATGDLTRRKLAPALYRLFRDGMLPEKFAIVAYARRDKNDESFRADVKAAIKKYAPELPTNDDQWQEFIDLWYYQRGEFDQPEGYEALRERLTQLDADRNTPCNRLYYLAIPPEQYAPVIENLGKADLARVHEYCGNWSRIIVEKPFGYDLPTARELNAQLLAHFSEEQIYRIDHYLGKETVQNILVFRFANELFEPLWNHKYIDHVQITVSEEIDVQGRGNYFDEAGIARDMLQNHALQILSLIAMEPPVSLESDAVRDEKVKALRSIRPIRPEDVSASTVRAQYEGYRSEEGVKPDSATETFAAMKLYLDNWRWGGTPFFLRAGKSMPERMTEVAIQFRTIPQVLFAKMQDYAVVPNILVMRIQPNEGIFLQIGAKEPGPEMALRPVDMHFNYREAFPEAKIADAYDRLLLDAIRGNASLFARGDEVEAAWSLMTPVLDAWKEHTRDVYLYRKGSWGPEQADALLGEPNRRWRNP